MPRFVIQAFRHGLSRKVIESFHDLPHDVAYRPVLDLRGNGAALVGQVDDLATETVSVVNLRKRRQHLALHLFPRAGGAEIGGEGVHRVVRPLTEKEVPQAAGVNGERFEQDIRFWISWEITALGEFNRRVGKHPRLVDEVFARPTSKIGV